VDFIEYGSNRLSTPATALSDIQQLLYRREIERCLREVIPLRLYALYAAFGQWRLSGPGLLRRGGQKR
jgi:hypothetical protein